MFIGTFHQPVLKTPWEWHVLLVRAFMIQKQHVTPTEFERPEDSMCYKHGTPNGVFRKRFNDNAEAFFKRDVAKPDFTVMPQLSAKKRSADILSAGRMPALPHVTEGFHFARSFRDAE